MTAKLGMKRIEKKQRLFSFGGVIASLVLCMGLWSSLESQSLQVGWFILAVIIGGMEYLIHRGKTVDQIPTWLIFLLPAALTVGLTLINLQQETTPGDYKEIENAVRYSTSAALREQYAQQAAAVMEKHEDKLTVRDAYVLRQEILAKNGWLTRANAAPTQVEARGSLDAAIRQQNEQR